MTAARDFCDLIQRLGADEISRSENDLSSRLSRAYEQLGLHSVIDTTSGQDSRRRPDIVLYVDQGNADLSGIGEVVIEAKKPDEIPGDLLDALLDSDLWSLKFLPYVRSHLSGIRYFCLTTFDRHLYIEITPEIRSLVASGATSPNDYEPLVRSASTTFDIRSGPSEWIGWITSALAPADLDPPPISSVLDVDRVSAADELEVFADELATLVAGKLGMPESRFALVNSVRIEAAAVADLPDDVAASLSVYVLAQHPGMDAAAAGMYLADHLADELANFVSASVQSLIGRLFAFKVIEDCFCIDVQPPLVEPAQYVFHSDRYDSLAHSELVSAVFAAVRRLETGAPRSVQNLASTGRFYDWIETRVDPHAFHRVFRAFAARNFQSLSGDLLGRFFEHYAQRVDKRRRRAFGQYYTPPPIVSFIWSEALTIAQSRGVLDNMRVLDPGAGSAAFLTEGARRMAAAGIPRFWERLIGFDIDPQVIGVAYVNLFLAVLGSLQREEADEVDNLRLYPTDALEPTSATPLAAYLPLLTAAPLRDYLSQQIDLSARVKASSTYDVVVGNPPYKNNSTRTLQQVAETFPRLLATSRTNARLRERNIRDDYAWFFAAADYYIRSQGLIGFVVSSSFCSADSYRYFRIDLLRLYRIHRLVHLGDGIFEDVGPRTAFVVIILERLETPLTDLTELDAHEFSDLRVMPEAQARLDLLAAAAAGDWSDWPSPLTVRPIAVNNHSLFPVGAVVPTVKSSGPALFPQERNQPSVFLKKWPGLITALDSLFRAPTQAQLAEKIRTFFECAEDDSPVRDAAIQSFFRQFEIGQDDAARIRVFMDEVPQRGLVFDAAKFKRVVSGTAPNNDAWYPSAAMESWVYYEPSLRVPRNVNEGRPVGYGTMTQWGYPEAHALTPKLIFTTATSPANGLKAFVVTDEWFAKLHGGTRQQLSYTGCENPLEGRQLDGGPNNLGQEAAALYAAMLREGYGEEDFLLYVASFYNSTLANEFLGGGGGKALHIPLRDAGRAVEIAGLARRIRNIVFAIHVFADQGEIGLRDTPYDLDELAAEGMFTLRSRGGGRFVPTRHYARDDQTLIRLIDAREVAEEELNALVRAAYGLS